MASSVDLKMVIQHIVNGTLAEKLCLVCLMPLDDQSEHVLTTICKGDKEYCIADIFEQIFQVKVSEVNQHQVCSGCFITSSAAYKFYLSAKRSQEILDFYTNELQQNMDFIDSDLQNSEDSICISLPVFTPSVEGYDFDLEGLALQSSHDYADAISEDGKQVTNNKEIAQVKTEVEIDGEIVMVTGEDGIPSFLMQAEDGTLRLLEKEEENKYRKMFGFTEKTMVEKPASRYQKVKQRRKRGPMSYLFCSQCPVKYRFVAKLKEHMKMEHNIDLYVCQVCKAMMEDEEEFNNHLKTHTNTHTCAICNMVFKKRGTIISHLKKHEAELQKSIRGSHICELCGQVLEDEEHLKQHYDKKHEKKYTCYYCGKMYKGELSFDSHIKKHEAQLQKNESSEAVKVAAKKEPKKRERKYHCELCGGSFMDERALMWHTRLHTNERPHICNECGRGFVSVNRRNQHAKCAHSAPARRCPLCPALFHLRSMVNTHIKKVHLKAHKRRNRTSKYQQVFWRTEPVPIEELSVSIQSEILELKAAQEAKQQEAKLGPEYS